MNAAQKFAIWCRWQRARVRDPVGRFCRALNVAAVRLHNPGVLEAKLQTEVATLRDALAISEARAAALEAERDRVLELARARGMDLSGRPPATDRAPYDPPVCLADEDTGTGHTP